MVGTFVPSQISLRVLEVKASTHSLGTRRGIDGFDIDDSFVTEVVGVCYSLTDPIRQGDFRLVLDDGILIDERQGADMIPFFGDELMTVRILPAHGILDDTVRVIGGSIWGKGDRTYYRGIGVPERQGECGPVFYG